MKITVSIIRADIGSIGGHIKPSQKLKETVSNYISEQGVTTKDIIDYSVSSTGDDIAIMMTHEKGTLNEKIHKLTWDAFVAGTEMAKEQGLYGGGQDLLKDAFSGNVKGMGPAVAELEFEERPNECFIQFAADKTEPGAYNLPFYLAFADPMYCAGLMLSPSMNKGYKVVIYAPDFMPASHTEPSVSVKTNSLASYYDEAWLVAAQVSYITNQQRTYTTNSFDHAFYSNQFSEKAGKASPKDISKRSPCDHFRKMDQRIRKLQKEVNKLSQCCRRNKSLIRHLKSQMNWRIVKVVLWILTVIFLLNSLLRG